MIILDSLIKLIKLSLDDTISLYRTFYILGFLTIFVFNTFYAKKLVLKKQGSFGDHFVVSFDFSMGICFGLGGKLVYCLGSP